MVGVIKLVGVQVGAVAIGLTLMLLMLRLVLPGSEIGFSLMTLGLTLAVIFAAYRAMTVRHWWLFVLGWFVGFIALTLFGLLVFGVLEPQVFQKIGPGGIILMLPFLVGFFAIALSGILNLLFHLKRQ
jgi:hypothetical protein